MCILCTLCCAAQERKRTEGNQWADQEAGLGEACGRVECSAGLGVCARVRAIALGYDNLS